MEIVQAFGVLLSKAVQQLNPDTSVAFFNLLLPTIAMKILWIHDYILCVIAGF